MTKAQGKIRFLILPRFVKIDHLNILNFSGSLNLSSDMSSETERSSSEVISMNKQNVMI